MIITRKASIPWSWVWLSQMPFAFWMFIQPLQSTAFTFSLRKFLDNPASIATVLSLAQLPVLFIAPVVNYASDKIWTRWGRRKPFYVVSNSFCAVMALAMPFAPNAVILTILLWFFYVGIGFGKTFFPLSQEIIPIPQRGRASAIHSIMFQAGILLYFSLLIGRFDDVFTSLPLGFFGPLKGEYFVYWIGALAMLLPTLVICLGIKELPLPSDDESSGQQQIHSSLFRKVFSFFREIFDPQWCVLYLLLFGGSLYSLGLGSLGALLYTDQWGYTKQDMGTNVAVGAIILMPMIVLGGYFADRFSKISIYLFCLCVTLALNIAYYLFVVLGLHNHRPSLWEIIVFGEMIAMCSTLANIVQWPLIFEYIPRTKMGTASAGMEMVSSIFGLVLGPLVGLWVLGYSQLFTPPAGFACHLEFSRPVTMAHLQVELAKSKSDSIRRLVIEPEENADSFQGRRWILFLIDNGDEVAADEQKGEEPSSAPHAKEAARENDLVSEAFRTTSDLDLNSVHTIFRPKQYDYFSAYLLTILGGILAIVIIFVVLSFEKRGIIKKLGVIEAADRPHEQSPVGH